MHIGEIKDEIRQLDRIDKIAICRWLELGRPVVFVRRGRSFTFRYSGSRRLRFRRGTNLFGGDVLKKRISPE
jgi:hypothetical protein